MSPEIPQGELLTTATIKQNGINHLRFKQAGLSEQIPFRNWKPFVQLVAMGLGKGFQPDLRANIILTSEIGYEKWTLREQQGLLNYRLQTLAGTSILGENHQQGDQLSFYLLAKRDNPRPVAVASIDVNRALVEHNPAKVLDFLSSTVALTAAVHRARALFLSTPQIPSRPATA